ncbi:hypothetical protein H7J88_19395 [Mycolicibacterium flavescens]|uniref:Uncharacterized protein n=1 Tax=Mycolicibacterium flavescens TaxID=1776 RepID=A0A1E3RN48_MYCFV|nr:hypothetical protein [Mycolicibacterium flavescens]MCV7281798.1 hypothetical protein [Mycolicibacterium flavescens]ODQ90817.1 hypothetical protein BHQ18_08825 [Mycolicibacterium flavescens]
MPGDDLLRFIGGPLPLPVWWTVLAVVLVLIAVGWCVGVLLWTLPPERLRRIPVLRTLHAKLIRRRFTRAIADTTALYQTRAMSGPQASAAYGRTLRSFLFVATGIRAQYLHLTELRDGELAKAVPVLTWLHDAQFNAESRADVTALGRSAEELIRTWS